MNPHAWLTLAVVATVLALLVTERVAPAVAVFAGTVTLLVAGTLTPAQALAGFSNPAPFTVAALYVVARAVEKTGALQPLLRSALAGRLSPRRALGRLLFPVAGASAVMNNTPIVAMLSPQVAAWARRTGQAPSRYLMPLSFATILGGLLTAIGTSTNLVVSGLMEADGMAPLGMFEITPLGLPIVILGVGFIVLASPKLLPDRNVVFEGIREGARDFVLDMEVIAGGALDGIEVEAGGLRHLEGVFLAEVRRGTEVIAPATPTTVLKGGDHLVFVGRADEVLDLQNNPGLRSAQHEHTTVFHGAGRAYFEAVVGPESPLIGQTLKQLDFRQTYQSAVLGIHRSGAPVRAKLGAVQIKPADTLLLLSDDGFLDRWRDRGAFLLIAPSGGMAPTTTRQAWLVLAVLVGLVVGNTVGLFPILSGALVAALVLVAGQVLTPAEATRSVDVNVILLVASSFGIGTALEVTGLASAAATGLLAAFQGLGSMGAAAGIVLATLVITELITNNAAAILVFPVAMAAAASSGLDPRAAALLVAVSASASFLTPIGYQTNTMVYGPGGYRFGDYARLGFPLTLIVIVVLLGWHALTPG